MKRKQQATTSGEDYLEAILVLQMQKGTVRSVDVARHMEVSKPSVSHAVATLRDGGFLTMDSDYFLHLTDIGRECYQRREFPKIKETTHVTCGDRTHYTKSVFEIEDDQYAKRSALPNSPIATTSPEADR